MKTLRISLLLIVLLALTANSSAAVHEGKWLPVRGDPHGIIPENNLSQGSFYDAGCTVIYAADESQVFGGNNEDNPNPDTRIWFIPPEGGKYGRALVGYDDFIWQGGMNDQGLFFDAMSVDEPVQVEQGNKSRYEGSLPAKALAECSDVDCVIDLFQENHAYDTWEFQFLFGDASGNSVIIEPLDNIFGGSFQVATNFYQSNTDLNSCRYCYRYWAARNIFESADELSVELMRDILNETHIEEGSPTQYSTVYDLKDKLIYLYHFYDYENERVFDLEEELAQGYHVFDMERLFPDKNNYYIYANRERRQLVEIRNNYLPIELSPALFEPFLGDFQGPEDLDMMYSYYSIDKKFGDLVLMMLPDKAWMKLEPISGTNFFHISYFDHFEISFNRDESGEVNGFIFRKHGTEYPFTRIDRVPSDEETIESEFQWAVILERIWKFTGTNTFKFLAIILGLVLLQIILQYLRSLLV